MSFNLQISKILQLTTYLVGYVVMREKKNGTYTDEILKPYDNFIDNINRIKFILNNVSKE